MLREELIDQFYNEFGYVPDEREFEDYQADNGFEEYHNRPILKISSTHKVHLNLNLQMIY